uniref:Tripartite motif-containing protein 3 n=1 Tax=Magallana gigas TaxID=29159 RepID=K1Q870_MAGGI|eukprot:XP_019926376.1 PREDICTED: uncharacterized protein LOC109619798 [Crassostrea gigas]
MDPHFSAHDVHRCDLCETAIVHSYCDFCHVNLCKPCILDHSLDEYDTHKKVPFKERRSTVTLVYPKCRTHPQKNCDLLCKNCNNLFVCSSCTASEQHRGHLFIDVTEVYKTKKNNIEKDIEELENLISPKYEEIALDLENQFANLDGGYEKLTTEMSKQGVQWHKENDIVINKMKTEIGEIKVKHRDILKKHSDEIKQIESRIQQTLLAFKKIEKSTEVSPLIEYISKIREFSKLPSRVHVSLPTFIPKPIDRQKLYNLFGKITPLTNTSVRELLDEPELVTTIQVRYHNDQYLRNVTCLHEDCIWTCGSTKNIKCFNITGTLLQTINNKSEQRPNDIALDGDGNLLFCDGKSRTVNKVKNGQTEVLLRLQGWVPNNLCVTSTGDLLVTMYSDDNIQSKVVRYSGSTEKQTIQFDNEGKPLFSGDYDPKYITENGNHDICVADSKACAVVVVNQDGELRWRYTGHPSVTKTELFIPRGITTDSHCRILTADCYNNCIHILDQNGQFLRYIENSGLQYPWGLCVDKDDTLFVSEYLTGNVKKIKCLR